jgi:hypothetical protein
MKLEAFSAYACITDISFPIPLILRNRYQTHGGKATLPTDSRGGGHLPNTKGSPVYCNSFLAYPQPGEFIVDTDARIIRFGEVPSQVEDGQERVIA